MSFDQFISAVQCKEKIIYEEFLWKNIFNLTENAEY